MPPAPKNGAALASLLLAILALIFCWLSALGVLIGTGGVIGFGLVPIIIALIAILLGIAGIRRASRQGASRRGLAIGGLVVGIIALIVSVLITIGSALALVVLPGGLGGTLQQAEQCVRQQVASGSSVGQARQFCADQAAQQVQKQVGGGG